MYSKFKYPENKLFIHIIYFGRSKNKKKRIASVITLTADYVRQFLLSSVFFNFKLLRVSWCCYFSLNKFVNYWPFSGWRTRAQATFSVVVIFIRQQNKKKRKINDAKWAFLKRKKKFQQLFYIFLICIPMSFQYFCVGDILNSVKNRACDNKTKV